MRIIGIVIKRFVVNLVLPLAFILADVAAVVLIVDTLRFEGGVTAQILAWLGIAGLTLVYCLIRELGSAVRQEPEEDPWEWGVQAIAAVAIYGIVSLFWPVVILFIAANYMQGLRPSWQPEPVSAPMPFDWEHCDGWPEPPFDWKRLVAIGEGYHLNHHPAVPSGHAALMAVPWGESVF